MTIPRHIQRTRRTGDRLSRDQVLIRLVRLADEWSRPPEELSA